MNQFFLLCFILILSTTLWAESGQPFIHMGKGRSVDPKGYRVFCETHKQERCDEKREASVPVPINNRRSSQEFLTELRKFNTRINGKIEAGTDYQHFGVKEKWLYSEDYGFKGDCEDFAIYKKRQLLAQGWPESAFSYAMVISGKTREWHTVLLVRTKWGDFVLDNLMNEVHRWDKAPHHFIQVTNPELPIEWLCVQNNPFERSWKFYKHLPPEKMNRVFCMPEKQGNQLKNKKLRSEL